MPIRLILVNVVTQLLAVVGLAAPIAASAGYDSRVSMPRYQLVPYTGLQITAVFDTPKVAFGDWITVTVDLIDLDDRINVEPVGGDCTGVGGQRLKCLTGHHDDRTDPDTIGFNITAPASTPPGAAGDIVIWVDGRGNDPNLANNTVRSTLDITNAAGSKVDISTASVDGRIGQTVTVPITGRNLGPNAIWALIIGGIDFASIGPASGLVLVGRTGCVGLGPNYCGTSAVPKGRSATIGIRVRVTGCGTGEGQTPAGYRNGFTGRETYTHRPLVFRVRIAGCPAAPPGSPTGGGSAGGGPTTDGAASPESPGSSPSAGAGTPPGPGQNSTNTPATVPAVASSASDIRVTDLSAGTRIMGWFWPAAVIVLLLIVTSLGWLVWRHRTTD